MGVVILVFLPFRFVSIFTGFTFTDAEDFAPFLTLLSGLLGVVLIRRSRQDKASFPLNCLLILLSLWPILPNFGLFLMARELQAVQGSWPQVMVDDPKNKLGNLSPRFDALFHVVNYLEAFSGAWMVVFVALFFAVNSRLSSTQRRFCIGPMTVSLFLVLIDPGNLYEWWLD